MANLLCGPEVGGFQDLATLAFLEAFGSEQALLTYVVDLKWPRMTVISLPAF